MEKIILGIFVLLLGIGLSAGVGYVLMLLLNYLLPVFWAVAPVITFYQAWALSALLGWFIK